MVLLVLQSLKHLDGKSTDQVLRDSLEIVVTDKLVKVDWKKLKSDDQMLTEDMIVEYPDNIVLVMRIIVVQELKNLQLHSSLVLELLFVPDNFDSHKVACLMIKALDSLSKTSRAESI